MVEPRILGMAQAPGCMEPVLVGLFLYGRAPYRSTRLE